MSESRQPLWRWIMLGLVALTFIISIIAFVKAYRVNVAARQLNQQVVAEYHRLMRSTRNGVPFPLVSETTPGLTRIANYSFYDQKVGLQSIEIWLMRKGNQSNDYTLFQNFKSLMCKRPNTVGGKPLAACAQVNIHSIPFAYRTSYTKKDNRYYQLYFAKLPNMLIKISVSAIGGLGQQKVLKQLQQYLASQPLFWQANNPYSNYLSTAKEIHAALTAHPQTPLSSTLSATLRQQSTALIQAVQQAKLPGDYPLLQQYKRSYLSLIAGATNKLLSGQNHAWHHTLHQLNDMQRLLLVLQMPASSVSSQFNFLTMQFLPYAEQQLKAHQNDASLCLVLQKHMDGSLNPSIANAILLAKQIAFMQLGHHYCSAYYDKISTWGNIALTSPSLGGQTLASLPSNVQQYYAISYAVYYKKFVLPLIPKATQLLKTKGKKDGYCYTQGRRPTRRNPLDDAIRQAYLQGGWKYCPVNSRQPAADNNGVQCLRTCKYLGVIGYPQDCIEKCKNSPGVLF